MQIGYGGTDKEIADYVWGYWLKLENVPVRTGAEVMEAVRASRVEGASNYEHMRAAMRLLDWPPLI